MIYTASYFQQENHHGELVSISLTTPRGFRVESKMPFLAPPQSLLNDWKKGMTEEAYIQAYRQHCRNFFNGPESNTAIANWLRGLSPSIDQTLLCWERAGDFCHRNLAIKFVQKYRPDCYGGMDIPF